MALTKARKAVQDQNRLLCEQISEKEADLRWLHAQLGDLRTETCKHPALKRGHAGGMSYQDCPDCGYGHP